MFYICPTRLFMYLKMVSYHANAATLLFYSKFTHVVGFYFVIECYLFTQGVIIIIFFLYLFI